MSTLVLTQAGPVRLAERVCSMYSLPRSMVNSRSCTSLVVALHAVGDLGELPVDLGRALLEGRDRLRRADAGHHVLALRVHQELAVELLLAGGGVAGEGHAGARVVAHVAEDHRLHVDRGAEVVRRSLLVAVVDGAAAVPGEEDGHDGAAQLLVGVGREVLAGLARARCP